MNTPTATEEKKDITTKVEQPISSTDSDKTKEIQKEKKDEIAKNLTDDQRIDLDSENEFNNKYGTTKEKLITNLQELHPKKYQNKTDSEIIEILKKEEPKVASRLEGYIGKPEEIKKPEENKKPIEAEKEKSIEPSEEKEISKPEIKKEDNNKKKRWNPRTRFKNKGGNEGKKEDRTNHMLRKIISPITAPLAFIGGGMLKALAKVESTIARPQDIFTKTYWTEFWKQEKDHGKTRGPSSEKGKWYKVPTWFIGKNRKVPAHFKKTVLHAAHETLTGLWKWKFKYTATKESWKKLTSWNYKKEASK